MYCDIERACLPLTCLYSVHVLCQRCALVLVANCSAAAAACISTSTDHLAICTYSCTAVAVYTQL
jgi:hypothetical protein